MDMRSAGETMEQAKHKLEGMGRGRTERIFHWMALGSIGASLALFIAGKKNLAIFVGLWPPTFEAMRRRS
jgi:hypothetical protein